MMLQIQLKGLHISGCINRTFFFFFLDGPVNNPARGDPGLGTQRRELCQHCGAELSPHITPEPSHNPSAVQKNATALISSLAL